MPFKTKAEQDAYNQRYYKDQRKNILRRLKERRETDPEKYREQKRESYRRNKTEINARKKIKFDERKREAVEYLGGQCQQCGLEDECVNVYDFHHRDPNDKDYEIAAKRYLSFEEMKKELNKCDLLCAICHRKIHSGCCQRQVV